MTVEPSPADRSVTARDAGAAADPGNSESTAEVSAGNVGWVDSGLRGLGLTVPVPLTVGALLIYFGQASTIDLGAAIAAWGVSAALMARQIHGLSVLRDYVTDLAQHAEQPAGTPMAPVRPNDVPRHGPLRHLAWSARRLHDAVDRTRQALGEQRATSAAVLDSLPDPLVTVDRERRIARANAAAQREFGAQIIGRNLSALSRHPALLESTDEVLAGGVGRVVEVSMPVPLSRTYRVTVTAISLAPRDGPAAVVALHDVTALRRTERMRADFVANASHELRTPLSSLVGFIETLQGPARDDTEARDRFLLIMQDQAARMARLVESLMSLSRIEMGEHTQPDTKVDLGDVVASAIAALDLKAVKRGMRLTLQLPPAMPTILGDREELTQVFLNLIDNAIKYGRPTTDVTITVNRRSATADGRRGPGQEASVIRLGGSIKRWAHGGIAVSVRDRGEGIPRDDLPRLTERFFRVDRARSRELGGFGLGLAIVKHIVLRHRGVLEIESRQGDGSTFTVILPIATSDIGVVPEIGQNSTVGTNNSLETARN